MEIKYSIDLTKVPAKLNPQQLQIVTGLKSEPKTELTKDEILACITPCLITKQDPWLIFKYYQPTFVETGMLILNKTNKPKSERKTHRDETVTLIYMGPPKPAEKVETVAELEAAGF